MKIFSFLAKSKQKNKNSHFADFFLHASKKDKEKVFTEAARRANEDQRKLIDSINTFDQKTT